MLLIECGLVLLAALMGFFFPRTGSPWFERVESSFACLARRHVLTVAVVGLTALALRVTLLPILPVPQPGVHDEFSYLLMADTFAHGRLSNPPHPMWVHFETFHVNQRPTYVSMFYPAQGLFLAAGQVVFGHPFWGVCLSVGLMCAATCWMFQGWLPPEWALLGGMLVIIRLGTFSYWANSYWGGSVAAIGGALVVGAFPRIEQHQRLRDSLLMGIGLAILANARPFEGLWLAIPVIVALLIWAFTKRNGSSGQSVIRVLLPLGLLVAAMLIAVSYYSVRTTGNPVRTPYLENVSQYNPVPYFPWLPVKPAPAYHHPIMRTFYLGWWLQQYEFARQHPLTLLLIKAHIFWFFFLGPLLLFPILMLGIVLPYGTSWKNFSQKTRFLLIVFCTSLVSLALPVFLNPHYAGPVVCVMYALVLLALKRIRNWQWHEAPVGVAIVRNLSVATVALFLLCGATSLFHLQIHNAPTPETWCSPWTQLTDRALMQAQLEKSPGKHLAIVHYGQQHNPMEGWVYNSANLDGSKVVWANDMGPQDNAELIRFFKDRHVWIVDPDIHPTRLTPYSIEEQAAFSTNQGAP
jgi:hypothetical protein